MDGILLIHPTTPVSLAAGSFIFLIFSAYYVRPWLAGMLGSSRIQSKLKLFQKKGATVMNHIQLATKTGDVLHIDHLIITNEQIIVISALGYSGEILGSIRSATWTQDTSQGRHRFPNPVRYHDMAKQTIASILGDRLKIRTISVFTAGNLHSTNSRDVVSATDCAQAMSRAADDITSGKKQDWATNIIKNVTLTDTNSSAEKEHAFIAKQGNEKHLKIARHLIIGSAILMLLAIILAGARLASNQASNLPVDWADEMEFTSSIPSNPNSTIDDFQASLRKL
ncbi:MAG: nuclease-related domain-containing protein [Mariprofundaceae bacterium]